MDKRNKPFYLHKGFQLIFTVVILAIFTLKTYDSLRYINIEESWPQYFSNLPDKHIQFGHGVTTVDAGMYVKNFFKFDIEQGDFEIEADVWFLFNPNLISLETISKFQFEHGYIIQKSSPITKMIGTDLFSVFQVRASFTSELLHRRFPFNDHRIFLTLKLVEILPEEMQFEVRQAGLRIADNVIPQGWQAKSFLAEAGYLKEVIHQQDDRKSLAYPSIIFALDFAKPGIRKVLVILVPTILLFFFALMALLVEGNPSIQLTIAVGSLTGLLVNRFVVESLSPKVNYFTVSDYIYVISLVSTLLVLLLSVYEIEKPLDSRYKAFVFFAMQIIAVFTYLKIA